MKIWFVQTPRIESDAKELARRTAESRYAQFVQHVVEQFVGGQRFLDDLPREVLADEVELANVAAEMPLPAPTASPMGTHGE